LAIIGTVILISISILWLFWARKISKESQN
jgi:hypothetical protein